MHVDHEQPPVFFFEHYGAAADAGRYVPITTIANNYLQSKYDGNTINKYI